MVNIHGLDIYDLGLLLTSHQQNVSMTRVSVRRCGPRPAFLLVFGFGLV